jgi:urease accessory protein
MGTDGLLGALQLADSSLPIGRFAHSYGLESMLAEWPELEEAELGELVETAIRESVGPLDGVAVAHAHRAVSAGELHELDAWLTARKLAPGPRQASTSCGRRLAALTSRLTDREPAIAFAAALDAGESDGNLAVVHGTLARALDVSMEDAVLLELRGFAAGMLSAAVRLGRLSALGAQALQRRLALALEEAAEEALGLRLDEAHSSAIELELASLRHPRREPRLFVS